MLDSKKLSLATSALELKASSDSQSVSTKGEVLGFSGEPQIIARLKEMGIHQGVTLEAYGQAPFGGPRLYRFGTTVLALRKEEAACIRIQKL